MLLSVWMDLVGNGPWETQSLSVAIALVSVPGGMWAGWSLFGRRAGLVCAALCAVNPFLTQFAQETRMYSLMLVLSLLATAAFLHVFAFGRRGYLPLFFVLLALMLYTHNWGLFLAVGLVCALVPCWYVSENRHSVWKDALIGFGGAEPRLCWFSDGGISSNFPLHMFDAPLPRWPTFAINLIYSETEDQETCKDPEKAVLSGEEVLPDRHVTIAKDGASSAIASPPMSPDISWPTPRRACAGSNTPPCRSRRRRTAGSPAPTPPRATAPGCSRRRRSCAGPCE
jgi:hypothetical protein